MVTNDIPFGNLPYEVVEELPEKGKENTIYGVPDDINAEVPFYTDYRYKDGKWEEVDLGETVYAFQFNDYAESVARQIADMESQMNTMEMRIDELDGTHKATFLYEDGTLVINAIKDDSVLHGKIVKTYSPHGNGHSLYEFDSASSQPWAAERKQIKRVEFGSKVTADNLNFWFQQCSNLTNIDLSGLNLSGVRTMRGTFSETGFIELSIFQFVNVENMRFAFAKMPNLKYLDLSDLGAKNVTSIYQLVCGSNALEVLDMSGIKSNKITEADLAFANSSSTAPNMALHTIYASPQFDCQGVSGNLSNMFRGCVNLVGGEGTAFSPSNAGKAYAKVDGGESSPGYFTGRGE